VHATIAGVALGLLTPAHPVKGREVLEGLEARIHPWSSFLIVPVFALANAGIRLGGSRVSDALGSSIALGVVVGLVIGKPLGIVATTAIAIRMRLGRLPAGVRLSHIGAAGAAAGIGFTVSLVIANLSYAGVHLEEAKVAILTASILSGAIGIALLRVMTRRTDESAQR
jgi:NhaA family Na+:H+ antiporter